MTASDDVRSRSESTAAAEPQDPEVQDAEVQHAEPEDAELKDVEPRDARPLAPTALDPRLISPRPYVDMPAGGPRGEPALMPRFTPRRDLEPNAGPVADTSAPPLPARNSRRAAPAGGRRPKALPAGRPTAPAEAAAGQIDAFAGGRPTAPADGRAEAYPGGGPGAADGWTDAAPGGWAPGYPVGGAVAAVGRGSMAPPPALPRRPRAQPVRAIIGDEIGIPTMWCEFQPCDATYTHPDALGERDLRARALAAGWRYDALGRRACPKCAQHDPTFWTVRAAPPGADDWRRAG